MDAIWIIIYSIIIALIILVVLWFGRLVFGLIPILKKAKANADAYRAKSKLLLKDISTAELYQKILNNKYLLSIKKASVLDWVISDIENGMGKKIVQVLSEQKLYTIFVKAEYELGHKGRPEAIDFTPEIWDLIEELALRKIEGAN